MVAGLEEVGGFTMRVGTGEDGPNKILLIGLGDADGDGDTGRERGGTDGEAEAEIEVGVVVGLEEGGRDPSPEDLEESFRLPLTS